MKKETPSISIHYKDLIIKHLTGQANTDDISELKNWMNQSPVHSQYFEQIRNTWYATSLVKFCDQDTNQAWDNALEQIEFTGENISKVRSGWDMIWRIAAIILIAFISGGIAAYFIFKQDTPGLSGDILTEIMAPMGSKSHVVLPDGSTVWLNAGSKLKYSRNYNIDDRMVILEGEGWFDIRTNPEMPFIVNTSEIQVQAYGTVFNVKAYPDEDIITTTLVEGIVKVKSLKKEEPEMTLKPNQNLIYRKSKPVELKATSQTEDTRDLTPVNNEPLPIEVNKEVETRLFTSWKDERWIIERVNLEEMVVLLERRFDVKFIINSEELKKYKISGTIRKETLEQVLDLLKLTTPLTYRIDEGIVTINHDIKRSVDYLNIMNK